LPPNDLRAAALAAARLDPLAYAVGAMPSYQTPPHILRFADVVTTALQQGNARLIVSMPPRHGKSLFLSRYLLCWLLGRHPDWQYIHATYQEEFARDFGREIRNQVATPFHRAVFPGSQLRTDSTAAGRFHTQSGGVYHAVGVGGATTGKGANLFIIDDPIKGPEDAISEAYRRRLKSWFQTVAYTRLMPGASVIITQTRWHEDDLAGWLLGGGGGAFEETWTYLNFPAIATEHDPLGRAPGEALWPAQFPVDRLLQIKAMLERGEGEDGSPLLLPNAFPALYGGAPIAQEGNLFKRDSFQFVRELPTFERVFQYWDTAYKADQLNDPSAGITFGVAGGKVFIIDVLRRRMETPEVEAAIEDRYAQYRPEAVLIEDKASGQGLIQRLRRKGLPILADQPENDKRTRAAEVTVLFAAGQVVFWTGCNGLAEYLAELLGFPYAAHDDQVDATSGGLRYYTRTRAGLSGRGRQPLRRG